MCRRYKPDIRLRFVTEELGFESDEEAALFACEHGGQDYLEDKGDGVRLLTGKVGPIFDTAASAARRKVDLKGQI